MNHLSPHLAGAGAPVASPRPWMCRAGWLLVLVSLVLSAAACAAGSSRHDNRKQPSAVVITVATPEQPRRTGPAVAVPATAAPSAAVELPLKPPLEPLQLCLVTRDRGVPPTYVPADLVTLPEGPSVRAGVQMRREPAEALTALLGAAQIEGQQLTAISAYRSYEQQQAVLAEEMKLYGPDQALRQVAPPGHSEHQLGVAVDVLSARDPNDLNQSFGDSPEGKWLAANAPRFGFVVSYPAGKEAVTGYIYEPWHIRYVGFPWAQQIVASGNTITEFLTRRGMTGC